MLKKSAANQGYLLLESLLAFFIMSSLLLSLIPLLIFTRQQQIRQVQRLESYRYLFELTQEYATHREITFGEVIRAGETFQGTGNYTPAQIKRLTVVVAGEEYEFIWQASF